MRDKFAFRTVSQLKKNIIAGSGVYFVNSLLHFFSFPIYLKYLTVEEFGIWSILATIISFSSIGNLGLFNVIVALVAQNKSNINELSDIFINSVILLSVPALLLIGISFLIGNDILELFNVPSHFNYKLNSIITLLSLLISLIYFSDITQGYISGLGRLDFAHSIFLVSNIIKVVFTVIFLSYGLSFVGIVYSFIIANVVLMIGGLWFLKYRLKYKLSARGNIKYTMIKQLSLSGGQMFFINLTNMIVDPTVKILLSNNSGLSSVTYYELSNKVIYMLRGLIEKAYIAIVPMVGEMLGESKDFVPKIVSFNNKASKISLFILIPTFLLASLIIELVFRFIMDDKYSPTVLWYYWTFVPGVAVGILALNKYFTFIGTGKIKYCSYEAIIRLSTALLMTVVMILVVDFRNEFVIVSIVPLGAVIGNSFILFKYRQIYSVVIEKQHQKNTKKIDSLV